MASSSVPCLVSRRATRFGSHDGTSSNSVAWRKASMPACRQPGTRRFDRPGHGHQCGACHDRDRRGIDVNPAPRPRFTKELGDAVSDCLGEVLRLVSGQSL